MQRLLQLVVANPIAVVLLVVMAVWAGVFSLLRLPVGLFPGLDVPVVNVIAHYPGAASQDMELLITRPIEDRIRTIPAVRRVSSLSIEGTTQITAEFEWGTRLTDARQLVQAQVSALEGALPAGVIPRIENIGTTLEEVAGYVVSGGTDLIDLRTTVQTDIATRLMGVEGVARVDVLGGDEPAFLVQLRPEALLRQRLTIGAVTAALARSNVAVAADYIERGSREYSIRGDNRLQTIEQVEAVPVVSDGTRVVLLRDIATVQPGRAPRHYEVRANAIPAVAFTVSKQPGASTLVVVRGIEDELSRLGALLPVGASIRKFYDQAEIVSEARNSLFHDLIVGAVLVVVVLFLLVGAIRATLIVAVTIPITLLATLAAMEVFGQTLNVITLSALTLAIGMVVDDTIIVSESIIRRLQSGEPRQAASLAGTAEIAGPDASGTFTTVAAFAPLLFIGGIAGLFVRPFGLVVSAALLISLVVSLTFVPTMFGGASVVFRRRALGAGLLLWLERALHRVLRLTFAHRLATIVLGVMVLGLGALAALLGPVRVLPPIDEGVILIEYIMPPGTSLQESNRVGDLLDRWAMAQPDVETVYRRTGSPAQGLQAEGVNRGELMIKLAPRSQRRRTLDQIMDGLRQEYDRLPGVVFLYRQPTQEKMDESLSGLPAMFGVTIFGPDLDELVSLAGQAEGIMGADPALANIINNTKVKSPQVIVRPNPVELARCDLSPSDVFETIQAARFGVLATTIVRQRQQVQVLVKTESSAEATLDWLEQLAIATPTGQWVPLNRVANVRVSQAPAAVTRLNGQREVTILAEVSGSISATVDRLRREFSAIELPSGYSIAFTGQYQVMARTIRDFVLVALAAVLLIYLIMAVQFGSWLQPLIILLTIPMGLVGAILLLVVTQVGLDISVGMGVLTLAGIAVNNAIVLVEYANRRVASGLTIHEALQSAITVRVRPILMTAATTMIALIPVAVNPAVGSRIFQPFAITVIGGLLTATVSTFLFVPVLRTLVR